MEEDEVNLMPKKARTYVSLEDKINIIGLIKAGSKCSRIAREYNISESAIYRLKKEPEKFLEEIEKIRGDDVDLKERKVMKPVLNLDREILKWIRANKSSSGKIPRGKVIIQKALQLNADMGGDKNFKASNGWLFKFKERHGLVNKHPAGRPRKNENDEDEDLELTNDDPLDFDDSIGELGDGYNIKEEYAEEMETEEYLETTNEDYKVLDPVPSDRQLLKTMLNETIDKFYANYQPPEPEPVNHKREPCNCKHSTIQLQNSQPENQVSSSEEPTNQDAFGAFEVILSWLSKQEEVNSVDIKRIKGLSEIAKRKMLMDLNPEAAGE